ADDFAAVGRYGAGGQSAMPETAGGGGLVGAFAAGGFDEVLSHDGLAGDGHDFGSDDEVHVEGADDDDAGFGASGGGFSGAGGGEGLEGGGLGGGGRGGGGVGKGFGRSGRGRGGDDGAMSGGFGRRSGGADGRGRARGGRRKRRFLGRSGFGCGFLF